MKSFSTTNHPAALAVEVEVALRSTDAQLRRNANELANAATRAHLQEPKPSILVCSPPGGGALEFSRHLATLSCQASQARLHAVGNPSEATSDATITSRRTTFFGPANDVAHEPPGRNEVTFCFREETSTDCRAVDQGWRVLDIPPLAARPGDAVLAAQIMVRNFFPPGLCLAEDACQLIHDFRWPGELAHLRVTLGVAAQKAFSLGRDLVDAAQITDVLRRKERNLARLCRLDHSGWSFPISGRDLLQLATFTGFARVRKALELLLIEGAVASAGGNSSTAARRLGLPYTTLVSRQKVLSQKRAR